MVPFIIFLILVIIYIAWNYLNVKNREQWREMLIDLNDEELIEEAKEIRADRQFMGYDEYADMTEALKKEFTARGLSETFDELDL